MVGKMGVEKLAVSVENEPPQQARRSSVWMSETQRKADVWYEATVTPRSQLLLSRERWAGGADSARSPHSPASPSKDLLMADTPLQTPTLTWISSPEKKKHGQHLSAMVSAPSVAAHRPSYLGAHLLESRRVLPAQEQPRKRSVLNRDRLREAMAAHGDMGQEHQGMDGATPSDLGRDDIMSESLESSEELWSAEVPPVQVMPRYMLKRLEHVPPSPARKTRQLRTSFGGDIGHSGQEAGMPRQLRSAPGGIDAFRPKTSSYTGGHRQGPRSPLPSARGHSWPVRSSMPSKVVYHEGQFESDIPLSSRPEARRNFSQGRFMTVPLFDGSAEGSGPFVWSGPRAETARSRSERTLEHLRNMEGWHAAQAQAASPAPRVSPRTPRYGAREQMRAGTAPGRQRY
mmetsp:Transcript_53336/g.130290  ORF Transcript_53336/g.130290 Transcript_53336/m.130290 type:complete len:401 (+) Transcript_53336:322-1524(+)